jgi:hypothetical protein
MRASRRRPDEFSNVGCVEDRFTSGASLLPSLPHSHLPGFASLIDRMTCAHFQEQPARQRAQTAQSKERYKLRADQVSCHSHPGLD